MTLAAITLVGLVALDAGKPRAAAAPTRRRAIEYNRDIRPILAENCFACHGPDSAARKADLRLDRREVAVEAGAIVPSEPEASELVARIETRGPQGADAAAGGEQDVDRGAEGTAPALDRRRGRVPAALVVDRAEAARALPQVKNEAWVRNPIDRFVLAKLEEHGLRPRPRPTGGRWRGG